MGPPWAPRGPPVGPPWAPRGPPVGPPWAPRGPPVGPPWATLGPPVAPRGPPVGPPRAPRGPPECPAWAPPRLSRKHLSNSVQFDKLVELATKPALKVSLLSTNYKQLFSQSLMYNLISQELHKNLSGSYQH